MGGSDFTIEKLTNIKMKLAFYRPNFGFLTSLVYKMV
jgi:hypothetical protein